MIDLYFWPTPNGWKITLFLEEAELPYRLVPVNIGRGEQFRPEFLAISPNNRMPAIVDHKPADGRGPLSVFESGAILFYLADKTGKFLPKDPRGRAEVMQWVMWQMGGIGPMSGQAHHFRNYAKEKLPYAIERYTNEVNRLYGVLDRQLASREFIAGELSIADMTTFPWVVGYENLGQKIEDFPHMGAWLARMKARPGVARGLEVGKELRTAPGMDDEARKVLFGQTAATIKGS